MEKCENLRHQHESEQAKKQKLDKNATKSDTVLFNLDNSLLPEVCKEPKLNKLGQKLASTSDDKNIKNFNFLTAKYDQLAELANKNLVNLNIPDPANQPIISNLPKYKPQEMSPKTITVNITSPREAISQALPSFCNDPRVTHTVIRGLTHQLKIDLGLFSTKSLIEKVPNHKIEIRTQSKQLPEENYNQEGTKKCWPCYSTYAYSTVKEYGEYQAKTLQKAFLKEDDFKKNYRLHKKRVTKQSKRDYGLYANGSLMEFDVKGYKNGVAQAELDKPENYNPIEDDGLDHLPKKFTQIRFGTNVDLADATIFKEELEELRKLPSFLRVIDPQNMLSHIGYDIYGMNTVQLYMKIPGCRTPGHRENLNFPAVNINIGPGDCEWYCVDQQYTGIMTEICRKKGLTFVRDSWWPILDDLWEHNVPVYGEG